MFTNPARRVQIAGISQQRVPVVEAAREGYCPNRAAGGVGPDDVIGAHDLDRPVVVFVGDQDVGG